MLFTEDRSQELDPEKERIASLGTIEVPLQPIRPHNLTLKENRRADWLIGSNLVLRIFQSILKEAETNLIVSA